MWIIYGKAKNEFHKGQTVWVEDPADAQKLIDKKWAERAIGPYGPSWTEAPPEDKLEVLKKDKEKADKAKDK